MQNLQQDLINLLIDEENLVIDNPPESHVW